MHIPGDPLDLPGPRRFWRNLAADVDQGRSLLLACPDVETVRTVHEMARSQTRRLGREVIFIELDRVAEKPAASVLEVFGATPPPGTVLDARTVIDEPATAYYVLWVEHTRSEPIQIQGWLEFLTQFEEAAKSKAAESRLAIVTVAPAGTLPLQLKPRTQRWWWGVVGRLDTATYVQQEFEQVPPALAACAVEIAKFDFELAGTLLEAKGDGWYGDVCKLSELLKDYAEERRLEVCNVAAMGEARSAPGPPADLVASWQSGAAELWEGRPEFNSAAVVASNGPAEASILLWQGQIGSWLPDLEARRRRLAAWVAIHHPVIELHGLRDDIWSDADTPTDQLEIGPLSRLVKLLGDHGVGRSELRRYAHCLREARNCLAHFTPIPKFRLDELARYAEVENTMIMPPKSGAPITADITPDLTSRPTVGIP